MMLTPTRANRRRAAIAVTAVALATASLAACSSSGTGTDAPGAGDSATSGTVDWWGWVPEQAVAPLYIAEFNKEFPDITVNYKNFTIADYQAALRPALAASTGPDVFDVASGAMFEQFGQYGVDLTPDVEEALGDDWESKIAPIGVTAFTDDEEKLRVVPVGLGFAGPLWINQDLFDQYSLTPPTTFEEWAEVCATFESNGIGCFTQGASQVAFNQDTLQSIADTINPGLFSKATTGEEEWTHPDLVTAFDAWQSLFTDGIMQDGALGEQQYPDANNGFLSGRFAMIHMGYWYSQYTIEDLMSSAIAAAGVAEAKPFTVVPIDFPAAVRGGTPGALFGSPDYGLAVNDKSDAKNAATTFALWLSTAETGQQMVADSLADVPSLKGIAPQLDGLVNPEVQQAALEDLITDAASVTEERLLSNAQLADAIGAATTTLASGDVTPEEAAEALQEAAVQAGVEY